MEKHYQLTDLEFENQFRDCTMDPSIFSHEGHIRLAWIHIRKYGLENAIENICSQIYEFDITHGKGDKFHKTLTIGSVFIVNHFIKKSHEESFIGFLKEFPCLKSNFKDLLESHYNIERLASDPARTEYLEPDILPF